MWFVRVSTTKQQREKLISQLADLRNLDELQVLMQMAKLEANDRIV